ncbi:hypothetical protein COOONC_19539 [Cooperia oncophora]
MALQKSNNDLTKAYNLLSDNKEPVHDVFASAATEWSTEDHEAGPSSDIFPTSSFRNMRRAVKSDDCSIFANEISIASKGLLINNVFDPVCSEFVDVYLPKCISMHVNPPEHLFLNDDILGQSVHFSKEVAQLIPIRWKKCILGRGGGVRRPHELIDLFVSSSGFSNVNELLRNHRDILTPKDVFVLLSALDCMRNFLDGAKMRHILLSLVEGSLDIINEAAWETVNP